MVLSNMSSIKAHGPVGTSPCHHIKSAIGIIAPVLDKNVLAAAKMHRPDHNACVTGEKDKIYYDAGEFFCHAVLILI